MTSVESAGVTVGDLDEQDLIDRITGRLPIAPEWLLVGPGDDAAVVSPERNTLEVITTDACVEGVHFDREFVPPEAIGHRALAANLSDLAAMGATPRLATLSLAMPGALPAADFERLVEGLLALASRHDIRVIGGNLSRSPGPLVVDVMAIGTVRPRRVLSRAAARPGDIIFVSGRIGAARAGLGMCAEARGTASTPAAGVTGPPDGGHYKGANPPDGGHYKGAGPPDGGHYAGSGPPDDGHYEGSRALLKTGATGIRASESRRTGLTAGESPAGDGPVERFLRPEPRVRLGVLLGRNRAATACMDLSDGLADGLRGLARASGSGLSIDADALPLDREAHAWFEARGRDPVLEAVAGGDDYELLFTVSPRRQRRLRAVARLARGLTLTRIGVVTRDSALVLRRHGRDEELPASFAHFGGGGRAEAKGLRAKG